MSKMTLPHLNGTILFSETKTPSFKKIFKDKLATINLYLTEENPAGNYMFKVLLDMHDCTLNTPLHSGDFYVQFSRYLTSRFLIFLKQQTYF